MEACRLRKTEILPKRQETRIIRQQNIPNEKDILVEKRDKSGRRREESREAASTVFLPIQIYLDSEEFVIPVGIDFHFLYYYLELISCFPGFIAYILRNEIMNEVWNDSFGSLLEVSKNMEISFGECESFIKRDVTRLFQQYVFFQMT